METPEPLYKKLKINMLKNNIILKNCLFVFDKLTNDLPDVFDQFFQPLNENLQSGLVAGHLSFIKDILQIRRLHW